MILGKRVLFRGLGKVGIFLWVLWIAVSIPLAESGETAERGRWYRQAGTAE